MSNTLFNHITPYPNRILQILQTPWGAVFAMTVWAGSILFYRLGDLVLDPDEALIIEWTLDVYAQTPTVWDLVKHIVRERGFYQPDPYPGLNIFLTVAFFQWLGVSTWTARLASALIALGVIPAFFCVSRRIFHHTTPALLGALLLATSAPIIFLMRQGRYTSLTILATLWLTWAYLEVLDRKKYGLLQLTGAVILSFFTAFHIFLPVAVGFTLHALWHFRGSRLWGLIGILVLFSAGVTWFTPDKYIDGPAWFMTLFQKIWSMDQITVLYKLKVYLLELNLISMPLVFIPIYVYVRRDQWNRRVVLSVIAVCVGTLVMLSPLGDTILKDLIAPALDVVWPSFSPWWFNRVVDSRSWLFMGLAVGLGLLFYYGQWSSPSYLALPIIVLLGIIMTHCVLPQYLVIWTRHMASSYVFVFLLSGYLLTKIIEKNKLLGVSMILLHMTSNILSVVPFVPEHYPYFQWKLPQWIYRLVTGDPISEIVTNFIRIPPL